jgi:hypothetical protein
MSIRHADRGFPLSSSAVAISSAASATDGSVVEVMFVMIRLIAA